MKVINGVFHSRKIHLPNPTVAMSKPKQITNFGPLILWPFLCQYPMNQAAGNEANEEPREYGRSLIPASNGDNWFTVFDHCEKSRNGRRRIANLEIQGQIKRPSIERQIMQKAHDKNKHFKFSK